jgi:hypothetical protein
MLSVVITKGEIMALYDAKGYFWYSEKHMLHCARMDKMWPKEFDGSSGPDGYNTCIVDGKIYPYSAWDSTSPEGSPRNEPYPGALSGFPDYKLIGYGEYYIFVRLSPDDQIKLFGASSKQ